MVMTSFMKKKCNSLKSNIKFIKNSEQLNKKLFLLPGKPFNATVNIISNDRSLFCFYFYDSNHCVNSNYITCAVLVPLLLALNKCMPTVIDYILLQSSLSTLNIFSKLTSAISTVLASYSKGIFFHWQNKCIYLKSIGKTLKICARRDHSSRAYAKVSEKVTFLTP